MEVQTVKLSHILRGGCGRERVAIAREYHMSFTGVFPCLLMLFINTIAMPLAAGVLYSFGILLSPALGTVLMPLSSIVVAINARLLRG